MKRVHDMPFGALPQADDAARFALWAPAARSVEVLLPVADAERCIALAREDGGFHRGLIDGVRPGQRYLFVIDGDQRVPDPASRFQPESAEGPSELTDPGAHVWQDSGWKGRPFEESVFYELHVGAFAPRGDYGGVIERLGHLEALGVTALELMPLAECPGARSWGYDGVLPFAPTSRHGRPEQLKALVDAAHARGLMVFLDVVYNHFGPAGNRLGLYAPGFFTAKYHTPWGDAIDFESHESRPVREFFIHNALYWLEEYHLDGLRLDAVHAIRDASEPDVLDELAARVHARFDGERAVHLVLENHDNEAHRLRRDATGRPVQYTAQWNDDIHHALHVLLSGESDGYYEDYAGDPSRSLGRCLTSGFAYQGEPSAHHEGRLRGEPSGDLPASAFVAFLQNHDQVGNRAFGERIHQLVSREAVEAATLVLLLSPSPPLLFMGQEWGADEPFLYFCDFEGELGQAVRDGRRREFARFPAFSDPAIRARIPDPCASDTFERSRLRWDATDEEPHRTILARHRELLEQRQREIVPRLMPACAREKDRFEKLGGSALLVEWTLADRARLSLLCNLGPEEVAGDFGRPRGSLLAETPRGLESALGDGRLPAWSAGAWLDAQPDG